MKVKHPQGIPPAAEPPIRKREDKSARADATASGLLSDLKSNVQDQFTQLAKDMAKQIARPILTRAAVGLQLGLVGAAVLGKKIQEIAEPLVGQARHLHLAGRVQQLKTEAAKLPPVFARELTVLEPDLAHYDASLNLDALAKDVDRAEFLIAEYRELGTLPDIKTLSSDAPERYQAAWVTAIETADHRAQQVIFRNHRLIQHRAELTDALKESQLSQAQQQFVAAADLALKDLNTPTADAPGMDGAINSMAATVGAVRMHTLTFDSRLHGHNVSDLFANAMRRHAEDLLINYGQLWTSAAPEHARNMAAIQQALSASAITAAAPLTAATQDRLLEALSWMGDTTIRQELINATRLGELSRRTRIALHYAGDILQRRSADNARWQALVAWAGVKDPRRLEYTQNGWGGVTVEAMNDNVITQAFREMVQSDNPAEQRQAELAKVAARKFIERLNDVAREPQEIALATDADWDILGKTILHDSTTLDGLDAVLARAEGIADRNKPADPTQKRIEFLALANQLLGAEGRNPGHSSTAQIARGHYDVAETMLEYMQRHYPFGISHATAKDRLTMMMADDADLESRRIAATVYEYYLYQQEQRSHGKMWSGLQDSPDLGIRAVADGAIRDLKSKTRYDVSAFETIPQIAQRQAQFNHRYQPLAALKALRDYEDQLAASKELIQEYTVTGKQKTAEEKFIYQLNAGMAVRIGNLLHDFDPLDLDKKLADIREARTEIHAGKMDRFNAITHAVEGSNTLAQIQVLTEEALKVNVARDLVREGVTFAAATIATAGVSTALELVAQSARLGAATEGVVAGAQTISRFKRAQQIAATIAKVSGKAIVKQGTFLHTKAAAELAIAGHQSLYDPNASIQDNLFNLGVSIVEFELMGGFHKAFKEVWQVAPAVERAGILRQLISGTRAKAHELVRDVVFFHGWLPAAGLIKTVAHRDTQHLAQSVNDFGSQEGLAHTAMMTVAMGSGLGTPLSQKLSQAVLRSRVPEIRTVTTHQKKIEKLEQKLSAIKGNSLKTLDQIAELRYQQMELAQKNAQLLDAAAARHPESEALRAQAAQLHLVASQYFHANRHAERLWSLTQLHHEETTLKHDYKTTDDLHARREILGDMKDNLQKRIDIARTMFAEGTMDPHSLAEVEKQRSTIAFEERLLSNTEDISATVETLESLPATATADQIADHVATLLALYSIQKELIRQTQKLIPKRFPPEATRRVDAAITVLTHALEMPNGIREATKRYQDMVREIQRGADYADTISVNLTQEIDLLQKAGKKTAPKRSALLTKATQAMHNRHQMMLQYAKQFGLTPSVLDTLKRQAKLETQMLQAAKQNHALITQTSLLLHMTQGRFHAMRLYLNTPESPLRHTLESKLERAEMEVHLFVEALAKTHPELGDLAALLPEPTAKAPPSVRPRGVMLSSMLLMPFPISLLFGAPGDGGFARVVPSRRTHPDGAITFETGIPGLSEMPMMPEGATTADLMAIHEIQNHKLEHWLTTHYLSKPESDQYNLTVELGVAYRNWSIGAEARVRDAFAQYETGAIGTKKLNALHRELHNEEVAYQQAFTAIDHTTDIPRRDLRKVVAGNFKSSVAQSINTLLGVFQLAEIDAERGIPPDHAGYREFLSSLLPQAEDSGYPRGMTVAYGNHEIARELLWWLNGRGTLHVGENEFTWEGARTETISEGNRPSHLTGKHPWPPNLAQDHALRSYLKFLGWSMEVSERGDRVVVTLRTTAKTEVPPESHLFGIPFHANIEGLSEVPMPANVADDIPEKVLHDQKTAIVNWLHMHVAEQERPERMKAVAALSQGHINWIYNASQHLRTILSNLETGRMSLDEATLVCQRIAAEGNVFIQIHNALEKALGPIENSFARLQRSSISQMHTAISGVTDLIPYGVEIGDPFFYEMLDKIRKPQGENYGLAIPGILYESARNLLWWLDNHGERAEGQLTWVRSDQPSAQKPHQTLFDGYLWPPSPRNDAILDTHLKILGWTLNVEDNGRRVTLNVPPEQRLQPERTPRLSSATVEALPEILRSAIRRHRFENISDEIALTQAILHDPTAAGEGILGQLANSLIWGALLENPQYIENPKAVDMINNGAKTLHEYLSALSHLPAEVRPEGQGHVQDATTAYLLALHHNPHTQRFLSKALKVVDHDYHTDFHTQLERAMKSAPDAPKETGFGLFGGPLMPVFLIEKFGQLMDRALQLGRDLLATRAATFQARAEAAAEKAQALPEGAELPLALRREKAHLAAEAERIAAELQHEEQFVPDPATGIPPIITTAIQAHHPQWNPNTADTGTTRSVLLTTLEQIVAKADLIPFVNDPRRPRTAEDLKHFPQELDDVMRGINHLPQRLHLPKEREEPIVAGYFRELCKDPFHRRQLIGALRLLDEHNTLVRRQPTQYSTDFARLIQDASTEIPVMSGQEQDPVAKGKLDADRSLAAHYVGKDDAIQADIALATVTSHLNWLGEFETYLTDVIAAAQSAPLTPQQHQEFAKAHLQLIQGMTVVAHTQREMTRASGNDAMQQLLHAMVGSTGQRFNIVRNLYDLVRNKFESPEIIAEAAELLDALKIEGNATPLERQQFERTFKEYLEGSERPSSGYFKDFPWPPDPTHPLVAAGYHFLEWEVPARESANTLAATRDFRRPAAAAETPDALMATRDVRRPQPEGTTTPRSGKTYVPMGAWRNNSDLAAIIPPVHVHVVDAGKFKPDFDIEDRANSYIISEGLAHFAGYIKLNQSADGASVILLRALAALDQHSNIPRPHRRRADSSIETAMESHLREAYQQHGQVVEDALRYIQTHVAKVAEFGKMTPQDVTRDVQRYLKVLKLDPNPPAPQVVTTPQPPPRPVAANPEIIARAQTDNRQFLKDIESVTGGAGTKSRTLLFKARLDIHSPGDSATTSHRVLVDATSGKILKEHSGQGEALRQQGQNVERITLRLFNIEGSEELRPIRKQLVAEGAHRRSEIPQWLHQKIQQAPISSDLAYAYAQATRDAERDGHAVRLHDLFVSRVRQIEPDRSGYIPKEVAAALRELSGAAFGKSTLPGPDGGGDKGGGPAGGTGGAEGGGRKLRETLRDGSKPAISNAGDILSDAEFVDAIGVENRNSVISYLGARDGSYILRRFHQLKDTGILKGIPPDTLKEWAYQDLDIPNHYESGNIEPYYPALRQLPPHVRGTLLSHGLLRAEVMQQLTEEGAWDSPRLASIVTLIATSRDSDHAAVAKQLQNMGYSAAGAKTFASAIENCPSEIDTRVISVLAMMSEAEALTAIQADRYNTDDQSYYHHPIGKFLPHRFASRHNLKRLVAKTGITISEDDMEQLVASRADQRVAIATIDSLQAITPRMAMEAVLHQNQNLRRLGFTQPIIEDGYSLATARLSSRYSVGLETGQYEASGGFQLALYDKTGEHPIRLASLGFLETDSDMIITHHQGSKLPANQRRRMLNNFRHFSGGVEPNMWLSHLTGQLALAQAQQQGKNFKFIAGENVLFGYPNISGQKPPHIRTLADARGPWQNPILDELVQEYQDLVHKRDAITAKADYNRTGDESKKLTLLGIRIAELDLLVKKYAQERVIQKSYDDTAEKLGFERNNSDDPFHHYNKGAVAFGADVRSHSKTHIFDRSLETATHAMQTDPVFGKWMSVPERAFNNLPGLPEPFAERPASPLDQVGPDGKVVKYSGAPWAGIEHFLGPDLSELAAYTALSGAGFLLAKLIGTYKPKYQLPTPLTPPDDIPIQQDIEHMQQIYHYSPEQALNEFLSLNKRLRNYDNAVATHRNNFPLRPQDTEALLSPHHRNAALFRLTLAHAYPDVVRGDASVLIENYRAATKVTTHSGGALWIDQAFQALWDRAATFLQEKMSGKRGAMFPSYLDVPEGEHSPSEERTIRAAAKQIQDTALDALETLQLADAHGITIPPKEALALQRFWGKRAIHEVKLWTLNAVNNKSAIEAVRNRHRLLTETLGIEDIPPTISLATTRINDRYALQLELGTEETAAGLRLNLYDGERQLASLGFQETDHTIDIVNYQGGYGDESATQKFHEFSGEVSPIKWLAMLGGQILLTRAQQSGKQLRWLAGDWLLNAYPHTPGEPPVGVTTFEDARRYWGQISMEEASPPVATRYDQAAHTFGFERSDRKAPFHVFTKGAVQFGAELRKHSKGSGKALDQSLEAATHAMQANTVFGKWMSTPEHASNQLPGLPPELPRRDSKVTKHSGAPFIEDLAKQAVAQIQDFFAGGKALPELPIAPTADFDTREAARDARRPILEEWVRRNFFVNPNGNATKATLKKFLTAADQMAHEFKQRLLANPGNHKDILDEWRRHAVVFQEVLEIFTIMNRHAPQVWGMEQTAAARTSIVNRIKDHLDGSWSATNTLIEAAVDLHRDIALTYDKVADTPPPLSDTIAQLTPQKAEAIAKNYRALFKNTEDDGVIAIRALDHFDALVRAGKLTEVQMREGAHDLAQALILGYAGDHSPIAPHSLLFYAHRILGLTERQATRAAHEQAKIWEDEAFAGFMRRTPGETQHPEDHTPLAATEVTTREYIAILAKSFHDNQVLDADLKAAQDDIVDHLISREAASDKTFTDAIAQTKDPVARQRLVTEQFIVRTGIRTDAFLRLLDLRMQSELRARPGKTDATLNPILTTILNNAFPGPPIANLKGHIDISDRDGILVLRPENLDDFAAIRGVVANKLDDHQNLPLGFFNATSTLGIPMIVISPDAGEEAWGVLRHELDHYKKFASNRFERGNLPPIPDNLVKNGKVNATAQTRFMNGMRDYLFKLAKDETLAHLTNTRPPQGVVRDLTQAGGLYDFIETVKAELANRITGDVGDNTVSGKHVGPMTANDYALSRIDTMRDRHNQGITQNVWMLYDAVETLVDYGYHPEAARRTLVHELTPIPYVNWPTQLPKIIAQLQTEPAAKWFPESLDPHDHHFKLRRWIERDNPSPQELQTVTDSGERQQLREVLHLMLGELESRKEVMQRRENNIPEIVRVTGKIDYIKTLIAAARLAPELATIIGADNAKKLETQLRPDILDSAAKWFQAYRDAGLSLELDPAVLMERLARGNQAMYPAGLDGIAAYKDLINSLPRELRTRLIERNMLRTSHFAELEKAGVLARPTVVSELTTLASYLGNVMGDAEIIKSFGYVTKAAAEFGITLTADETRFLSVNNAYLKTDLATDATLDAITPREALVAQVQRYHILKDNFHVTDGRLPTETIATTPINDRYSIKVEIGHKPTDVESACGFNIKLYANNNYDIATISVQVTDTSIDVVRYQGSRSTTSEASAFKDFSGGVDPMPWFAQVIGSSLLAQAAASGKTLRFISGNHIRHGYPHEHGRGPEFIQTIDDARTFWTTPPKTMTDMVARYDALNADLQATQRQYDELHSMQLYGKLASIEHELNGIRGTVTMFRAGPRTQELYDTTAQNLGFRRKGNSAAWHRYTKDSKEFGSAIRSRATDAAQFDQSTALAKKALAQMPRFVGDLPGLPPPLADTPGFTGSTTHYMAVGPDWKAATAIAKQLWTSALRVFTRTPKPYSNQKFSIGLSAVGRPSTISLPFATSFETADQDAARAARHPILKKWVQNNLFVHDPEAASTALDHVLIAIAELGNTFNQQLLPPKQASLTSGQYPPKVDPIAQATRYQQWKLQSGVFRELAAVASELAANEDQKMMATLISNEFAIEPWSEIDAKFEVERHKFGIAWQAAQEVTDPNFTPAKNYLARTSMSREEAEDLALGLRRDFASDSISEAMSGVLAFIQLVRLNKLGHSAILAGAHDIANALVNGHTTPDTAEHPLYNAKPLLGLSDPLVPLTPDELVTHWTNEAAQHLVRIATDSATQTPSASSDGEFGFGGGVLMIAAMAPRMSQAIQAWWKKGMHELSMQMAMRFNAKVLSGQYTTQDAPQVHIGTTPIVNVQFNPHSPAQYRLPVQLDRQTGEITALLNYKNDVATNPSDLVLSLQVITPYYYGPLQTIHSKALAMHTSPGDPFPPQLKKEVQNVVNSPKSPEVFRKWWSLIHKNKKLTFDDVFQHRIIAFDANQVPAHLRKPLQSLIGKPYIPPESRVAPRAHTHSMSDIGGAALVAQVGGSEWSSFVTQHGASIGIGLASAAAVMGGVIFLHRLLKPTPTTSPHRFSHASSLTNLEILSGRFNVIREQMIYYDLNDDITVGKSPIHRYSLLVDSQGVIRGVTYAHREFPSFLSHNRHLVYITTRQVNAFSHQVDGFEFPTTVPQMIRDRLTELKGHPFQISPSIHVWEHEQPTAEHQPPAQLSPSQEYLRIRDEIARRRDPYVDINGKQHKPVDVLEAIVDFRDEPTQAHFDKIPDIPGLTTDFRAAHPQFQKPAHFGWGVGNGRVALDLNDFDFEPEPCQILDLPDLQAVVKDAPLTKPIGMTRNTPPPRHAESHDPEPTFTLALEQQGLDPKQVKAWAVRKEEKRIKHTTARYAGAATLAASAVIAVVAMLFARNDDDDEDADASLLVLSERTVNGIQKKITDLTAKLKEVSPTAVDDEDYGSDIEVRGRNMADARVYSKFITLREHAIRKGERITANDLEMLLNKEGVTDLRARLQFYKLASGYFEHVSATQKRLAQIIDIEDKIPTKISDADKIAKFVAQEFGFIPKGKVELMVRDVHIMTVFHDPTDYAAASAPHDPLWRKDPKDYTPEEKARLAGILQFAERTAGMSFGGGVTIQKHYGYAENSEILKHEEGHEMDALGPYFAKPVNPWADPQLGPRLKDVSGDLSTELDTADKLLDFLFSTNAQYSFHTEFIQYLREGGRLSGQNPLARGGLYDPMIRGNYENVIKARYASHPELRDEVLKRLHAKYEDFYKRADHIYETLKQLDVHFENDTTFEDDHKAKILAYLAIRGTRDWDLEFLRSFKP